MSRNSQELMQNKLKNPVYCEIIFKMKDEEVYLSKFYKQFNKGRVTLLKQLHDLRSEGYLNSITKGKRVYYSVNWFKVCIGLNALYNEVLSKFISEFQQIGEVTQR